jgi:hypothetical protein
MLLINMYCAGDSIDTVTITKVPSTRTQETFAVRVINSTGRTELAGVNPKFLCAVSGKPVGWTCCSSRDPRPGGCSRPRIIVKRDDLPSWALVLVPDNDEFDILWKFLDRLQTTWKRVGDSGKKGLRPF